MKSEIVNKKYIKVYDLPLKINNRKHKLWMAKVINYDPNSRYPLQSEYLSKKMLGVKYYYNINFIEKGDFLKVKCVTPDGHPTVGFLYVNDKTEDFLDLEVVEENIILKYFKENTLSFEEKIQKLKGKFPEIEDDKLKELLHIIGEVI